MYVNITTRETVDLPTLRRAFPHMSFPADGPDDATLAGLGYAEVAVVEPPTITETQTVAEGPPELADGVWRQTWVVSEIPAEEYAAKVTAAKDAAIQAAKDSCQAVLVSLATRFSDLERQTWERQLAEATAILQDTAPTKAKYPVIGGIIEVTGETFSDFAMAVQANNEAWSAASANIIGQRQKLVAQIKAATTVAGVAAVGTTIILPS